MTFCSNSSYKYKSRLGLMALAVFVIVFICLIPAAHAGQGTISGSVVNVRSGPDSKAEVTGTLLKDTRVEIVNSSGSWSNIKYANLQGWVASEYINTTAAVAPTSIKQIQVLDGPINVRSGPAATYDKLGSIADKAIFKVLGEKDGWYQIQLSDGRAAYVAGWLVEEIGSIANQATPAVPVANNPNTSDNTAPTVIFNQKTMQFEVAPRIENGRTLVPLRAIFEAMGARVEWDENTRTVTARSDATTVILPMDSISPTVNGQVSKLEVSAKIVNGRTLAPLRFVGEAFGGQVDWDAQTRIITITYVPASAAEEPAPAPVVEPTPITPIPEIDNEPENVLHLSRTRDADGIKVMISSKLKMEPKIKESSGSIQYEFADRPLLGLNYFEEKVGSQLLKVKAGNQDKDTLIAVSLPTDIEYKMTVAEDGKQLIVFIPNYIINIEKTAFGSIGDRFILSTLCPVTYSGKLGADKLEIKLPNLRLKKNSSYNFTSDLVSSMKVESDSSNKDDILVTFISSDLDKYSFATSGSNSDLNIILMRKMDLKPREKIVVLDAGHGGSDTGARGSQLDEKVVNLAVTLKAGELLKAKGIRVEYTRIDDSYIGLEERSNIANHLNAALFVSVHSNSTTSAAPCGTETYFYAPLTNPDLYVQRDERSQIATLLQNEMLNKLQRNNRGVKENNYAVLRNAKMPSALVEMAFLSNPDDQALLMNDDFRNLAATAIANAVAQYMNSSN